MSLRVIHTPRSLRHLEGIFDYIAGHGDPIAARLYTKRLEAVCQSLDRFPHRGLRRDDIRPGLRTLAYKKIATIAYFIEADAVIITGVFKAGQDYERILSKLTPTADKPF